MRIFSSLSFLLLFCAITHHLSAQKNYLFRHYTVKDGLPNNSIFSISQDKNGYLWITTDGGISRFDGSYFDNTVLPEVNKAQAFSQYIEKMPDGNLAFATFMQGTFVEQDNGTYKQFLRREKQVGKNVVRTLKALPDGQLLFSESRNINIIEKDTIRQIYDCGESRNMFQTLEYDQNSNIWFGGIKGLGIFLKNDTARQPFFLPELKDIFVVKILLTDGNKLRVGTKSGYYEVEIQRGEKEHFSYSVSRPIPQLNAETINHIYRDHAGDIWISSIFNGVYRIRNQRVIQHLTLSNGMLTKGAMCVFQDSEGNYWFGTSDGLSKLDSFSSFSYRLRGKALTNIAQLAKDHNNRIWLCDEEQLILIKGDSLDSKSLNDIPFLKNRNIQDLSFHNQNMHFFLDNGIYALPVSNKMNWTKPVELVQYKKWGFDRLRSYFYDNDILWLASDYGLYFLQNGMLKKCSFDNVKKEAENLRPEIMLKDSWGNYWIGDRMSGLYRIRFGKDEKGKAVSFAPINVQAYKSLKADSSFVTAWIQDLKADEKGNLWLSSLYTGVYKLKISEQGVDQFKLYSTANGLSSNDVTRIAEGKDNSIWFATRNGVDRLIYDNAGNEKWEHYNDKNGFGRTAYNILIDDSITYAGYEEGFYAINNNLKVEKQPQKLKVLISEILVMNKPDTANISASKKTMKLPYNKNYLSFKFGAVTFNRNHEIKYQYYLDGLENQWNRSYSDQRFAEYAALPPGQYTFYVRCKRDGANAESEASSFRFVITPPFYRTWWFISLVLILVAGTLFLFYRNRIRQLIEMEKMRHRIASDLHDDIGSTLSSISIMSNVLQTQIDNSSHSSEIIRKIGENAHTMLESMDDIIWSVNPANDKFENLNLRICEYAIPLFETSGIGFRVVAPEELNSVSLTMDVRRNIFLICKEAVNNLVKYSCCANASIIFSLNHSFLTMIVKDDGKGFRTDKNPHRNGLKNMKRRAEQIGGKLIIGSEESKGTTITLNIKVL